MHGDTLERDKSNTTGDVSLDLRTYRLASRNTEKTICLFPVSRC